MPDYKSLYFKLFSAQNKAIEILVQAERETEELVMNNDNMFESSTKTELKED